MLLARQPGQGKSVTCCAGPKYEQPTARRFLHTAPHRCHAMVGQRVWGSETMRHDSTCSRSAAGNGNGALRAASASVHRSTGPGLYLSAERLPSARCTVCGWWMIRSPGPAIIATCGAQQAFVLEHTAACRSTVDICEIRLARYAGQDPYEGSRVCGEIQRARHAAMLRCVMSMR